MAGDISQNFSRHEFACHDYCGFDTADTDLIWVLEDLREYFNEKYSNRPGEIMVFISSGCRCLKYNTKIGGASKSFHMWGQASDVKVSGVSPKKVADYLESKYKGLYGIGRYKTFTHIDVRSKKPARWGKN